LKRKIIVDNVNTRSVLSNTELRSDDWAEKRSLSSFFPEISRWNSLHCSVHYHSNNFTSVQYTCRCSLSLASNKRIKIKIPQDIDIKITMLIIFYWHRVGWQPNDLSIFIIPTIINRKEESSSKNCFH